MASKQKKTFPQIYVYEDKKDPGWLKVGYTTRKKAEDRIREQFNTRLQRDSNPYIYHHVEPSIDNEGKAFTDKKVHKILEGKGINYNGEFFQTDLETVKSAILAAKRNETHIEDRSQTFKMRLEQKEAVELTEAHFKNSFENYPNIKPKFLWNAKMRFGKTFTSYQLAKRLNFKKILVITYKPAVEASWKDDLLSHIDFLGWQFVSRKEDNLESLDRSKPFVYFASFQDLLGTQEDGSTKKHNEWLNEEEWDIVIQDEYHYGAWRNTAKELMDSDDSVEEKALEVEDSLVNEENIANKIKAKSYLYLSGTPFKAIASGEFLEDQIFNWTYADEQRMKAKFAEESPDNNPYESLPEMHVLTYQLPEKLKKVALRGEFDEFSLSYFFKAKGHYDEAEFINEDQVLNWLDMMTGKLDDDDDIVSDLKKKQEMNDVVLPFNNNKVKNVYQELNHMLWLLPNVASVYAMAKLLEKHSFYKNYKVIIAAGKDAGSGVEALKPVRKAMANPFQSKTITLSCGKLTTGVTVPQWTGIFMLRTLNSPESYFQTAFRAQSSWTVADEDNPGKSISIKDECYVFDFDPNRALSQIAEYSRKLDSRDVSQEAKIAEFIKYLPILAYDGFAMEAIDAVGLLDMTLSNTTSTLLARGWNSNTLFNTDNNTLTNIINNEKVMDIINSIQSHRSKNTKVDKTILNNASAIKSLQTKSKDKNLNKEEKKKLNSQLSSEKREYIKKREVIQEKLKTLVTRLPLFMYLTDYREEKLTDIILKLQPELFTKVTRVSTEDFETLLDAGAFKEDLLDNAVVAFRRYEEASISYTGINRHNKMSEVATEIKDLDKTKNIKYYEPKNKKFSNSRLYDYGGHYTIHKGSEVIDETTGKLVKLENDENFPIPSEAAKFITKNTREDYSFFKTL